MSIKPEETNLGQYSFKFTPYSKQDHFALCHLAKLHGTSKGQVIKMAFHEWLKDNLPKEIEPFGIERFRKAKNRTPHAA